MGNAASSSLNDKNSQLAWDVFVSIAFVFTLCLLFEIRWETNDDVAMSMVAHGYGIAAFGMPNLVFSNVVWGYLVRAIPQINGVLGYSIATIGVLVVVGAVVLHGLRKLSFGWLVSLSVLMLLLARPVLFPQFTINAGLLTVGAVICWHFYALHKNRRALLIGCLLAFCGYIVRSHEFLLVWVIALPLLPWAKLARDRSVLVSGLILLLAIGGAAFMDHRAYQGDDWRAFSALNPARAPITDFGADIQLKKHPEILARHGYTANDIDLIRSWFFVDSKIVNPNTLNVMLAELGPLSVQHNALSNGWRGIKTFAHPVLLPIFSAAILLLLLLPNRKVFAVWILCFSAIFALGMMGRPGVLRVYIPIMFLLLITPLLLQSTENKVHATLRQRLVGAVIVITALFNATAVFSESRAAQLVSDEIRREFEAFPDEVVVVWGNSFPYEALYPVLKSAESTKGYKLFSLGVFTQAPFSVSYSENKAGKGMVIRLVSTGGVPILGGDRLFRLLNVYCAERLNGVLHEISYREFGERRVSWRQCETQTVQ